MSHSIYPNIEISAFEPSLTILLSLAKTVFSSGERLVFKTTMFGFFLLKTFAKSSSEELMSVSRYLMRLSSNAFLRLAVNAPRLLSVASLQLINTG